MFSSLQPFWGIAHNRLATRRQGTTYCYDFTFIFENALRKLWQKYITSLEANRKLFGHQLTDTPNVPGQLITITEYVVLKNSDLQA